MKKYTREQLEEFLPALENDAPEISPVDEVVSKYDAWEFPLNKTQLEAHNNLTAKYILLYGERASGKTWGAVFSLIDHCFNTVNALAVIITETVSMGEEGGAWYKLNYNLLPIWKEEIGLKYTTVRIHATSRKPYIWIQNRFGGWCRVFMHSMPVDANVADRVKGIEATFALVDEAQTLKSDTYFSALVQQLGRRPGIPHQRIFFCCNPRGPSHWLYHRFFELPLDSETGEWNDDYAVYHVPFHENRKNIPADYYDRIVEAVRNDPVEAARMLDGKWIDRPEADALFSGVFSVQLHVKPSDPAQARLGVGLYPLAGHVVLIGFDLGPAHTSISFLQLVPTLRLEIVTDIAIVFDELNFVGKYAAYRKIAPKVVARMDYWQGLVGPLQFDAVAGEDAFNIIRSDGSFDAYIIQEASGGRINLRSAPRGKGSVAARTRMIMEMLQSEELLISAQCGHTIEMFNCLQIKPRKGEWTPDDDLEPKRSPHLHVFDSLSYPLFAARFRPGRYRVLREGLVHNELVVSGR